MAKRKVQPHEAVPCPNCGKELPKPNFAAKMYCPRCKRWIDYQKS